MIASDWHRFEGGWACQFKCRDGVDEGVAHVLVVWNRSRQPRPSQQAKFMAAYEAALVAFAAELERRLGIARAVVLAH